MNLENFPEVIKTLAKRVQKIKDSILTEEATKTSVIMPFFQALNYDIFNPEEFVPEYTADVGIKKGEKVDYAIMQDGNPIILIEAKSIQEALTKHDSQLFRYFGTTKAKFAILTNGIIYRFYTDLEEQNKMDTIPFFELNLLDIRDNQIIELYKFCKNNFNVDNIFNTASELKYTNEVKQFLRNQWETPTDDFISFIISDVYQGKKTKQVIEKFSIVVKRALKEFVNDTVNDKLKAALANTEETIVARAEIATASVADNKSDEHQIITTEEEIEGYVTIKLMLKEVIDPNRIYYRDNSSYFNILVDDSIRKWICRLGLNGNTKYIQFNDDTKSSVNIDKVSDIFNHKEKIFETAKKFI